jgi:CDP-diacylglycerol--glycerol-3-phosphate 3-phosphatidyltransferase
MGVRGPETLGRSDLPAGNGVTPAAPSARGRRWKFYFVQGLTLVRAPLIFVFLGVTVFCSHPLAEAGFIVAFGSMIISAVTDLFDGYFARKFQVTSQLGSYADPMTDKIFYLTTFPTLVYVAARVGQHAHARALLVLTILFLLRDQWVSFLRSLGALHNLDAKANWSGKARTVISFPTICAIYFYLQAPPRWGCELPASIVYGLEGLSVAINLVSIVVYTMRYWPALRIELRPPEK